MVKSRAKFFMEFWDTRYVTQLYLFSVLKISNIFRLGFGSALCAFSRPSLDQSRSRSFADLVKGSGWAEAPTTMDENKAQQDQDPHTTDWNRPPSSQDSEEAKVLPEDGSFNDNPTADNSGDGRLSKRPKTFDGMASKPTSSAGISGGISTASTAGAASDVGEARDEVVLRPQSWSCMLRSTRTTKRAHGVVGDEDYSTALGASLWTMQQESLFTDATVEVDGKVFHCHRAVMCAGSGLFRAMFTGGLRESAAQTAQIHDVSAETFAIVVRFLYTGEARLTNVVEAERVLLAADLLDVVPLRKVSATWIHDNLTASGCARIWGTADQLCEPLLAGRARDVACQHILTLLHDEAFLLELRPQHIAELLQTDTLSVNSEDDAVELVTLWIDADPEVRQGMLPSLVHKVRLGAVSASVAEALQVHLAATPVELLAPHCL